MPSRSGGGTPIVDCRHPSIQHAIASGCSNAAGSFLLSRILESAFVLQSMLDLGEPPFTGPRDIGAYDPHPTLKRRTPGLTPIVATARVTTVMPRRHYLQAEMITSTPLIGPPTRL